MTNSTANPIVIRGLAKLADQMTIARFRILEGIDSAPKGEVTPEELQTADDLCHALFDAVCLTHHHIAVMIQAAQNRPTPPASRPLPFPGATPGKPA